MKKLMKGTSCLLSVLLVFSLIIVAFSPLVAHAETFSNVSEFPNFDMDCYVADLFTKDGHSLNTLIESELNSESRNKIMKNSIESNSILMGSMTAWQVATFETSDVTSDSVTELGYYESIILSSINTAMKSSRVKDFFDNAVIKDGKMLFSSFKDILKSEYFITDFSLDTYNSLSAENQSAYIKSFGEAFKKQYPKLDKTGDALKIFSTVVKAAKSFEECMNNYAAYAFCSLTNKHLTKVINDLYEQCPAEKVTMKAALLNISSACTSIELDLGADALDAIYRGADIIFGVLTDGWVTKIISAHPAGLAMMLGRAVGKTVSNILFSTDAICENYYKMCCFDEFEQLVRSVTRYEMSTYTKNKTNDNANNMFWAIRLMYNINEVGCDLSIDYAKTIYDKSVAGIFLDKTEYENYKKTVEFIRNWKRADYSTLMTSYIFYLEEDYPEIYAAYKKLIDEIENPVVHATGISFSKKHMTLGLADDAWFFWNNAEVTPSNATNRAVSYSSSDESIVSIKPGNTLMIELHQTGTVTITATSEDGGFTDQLTINVVEGHGTDGIHLEDPVTNITESGKCGDIVYYNLYNDGMLKIYGNGSMWDYTYNSNYYGRAPWENLSVKQVVIENGVTSIGKSAFAGCTGLTCITIPDSVTSIGWGAFFGCTGLTSVTIPDSVTSIGDYAFNRCTGLTSVTIGNGVTSIDTYAFYGCTSLKSITIPDSVTRIGYYAFSGCTGLTSVTIGNGVTSIDENVFISCTGLTSVTIGNGVTSIGSGAFSGCKGLTSVTIPDSVTSIGYEAFYRCTGLTSVTIPDSVTSIGNYAFGYTMVPETEKKIESFTIFGKKGSAAEAYANENGFKFIEMSNFIEKTDKQSNVSVTMTTELDLNVKEVTQSNTVKSIVLQTGESVINAYDITMLKNGKKTQPDESVTVKIPCDNSKAKVYRVESDKTLTDMNAVYQDGFMVFTTNHFSVYVVAAPSSGTTGDCTWTFDEATGTLTISGKGAMADYSGNESNISWKDLEVKSIVIADGVTSIGGSAFLGNSNLQSITIPSSVENIGDYAFALCSNLKDVSLTDGLKHIGEGAFENCPKIKMVTIPDSVTEIKKFALGYVVDLSSAKVYKNAEFTINYNMSKAAEQYAINNGFNHSNSLVSKTGDVNADGKVNGSDAGLLSRYTSGWDGYESKIKSMDAADINRDGKVNGQDAAILARHTSGWDGYERYFK